MFVLEGRSDTEPTNWRVGLQADPASESMRKIVPPASHTALDNLMLNEVEAVPKKMQKQVRPRSSGLSFLTWKPSGLGAFLREEIDGGFTAQYQALCQEGRNLRRELVCP